MCEKAEKLYMCGEGEYIYKIAPIVECLVNYRSDCYLCAWILFNCL